jgi:hypothetical protein
VRFGRELLAGEDRGHEDQEPEQRIVTDFRLFGEIRGREPG